MKIDEKFQLRFDELSKSIPNVFLNQHGSSRVDMTEWGKWTTNALNLLVLAMGEDSVHYKNFIMLLHNDAHPVNKALLLNGIFFAAKDDYSKGFTLSLAKSISGEMLGNFINLAKASLAEGHKDVAAVLACAAFEDCMKKFAISKGIDVTDKVISDIINALKAGGFVSGARKAFLEGMPKIRNYTMHAEWDKITADTVSGVIGFVEQFLIENF